MNICNKSVQSYIFKISNLFIISHFSPLLQTDKSIEDGVLIFPSYNSTHQPCLYDVSILRDNVTDLQLCFTLLSDASAQLSPLSNLLLTRSPTKYMHLPSLS